MRKNIVMLLSLLSLFVLGTNAFAGQIKAYVSEFAVTGQQNKDELKGTLQTLLASRLNGDDIRTVDSAAAADIVIDGSYIVLGKMFSLEAVAKNPAGVSVARVFEQGTGQDDLLPALNKLAQKLGGEIVKAAAVATPATPAVPVAIPAPVVPSGVVRAGAVTAVKEGKEAVGEPAGEIVKAEPIAKRSGSAWTSQRLTGALVGIAAGRTLADGVRELYVVDEHALRYYHMGAELKLVAEVAFTVSEKILGVDTADLDGDGIPEAYLTIMDGETLASQVWIARDGALQKVAEKLPYFCRAIALDGKEKKIYVQQMGRDADFYGDIFELVKTGNKFEIKNPIKLPRFGFLYNFNRFTDAGGKSYYVLINGDGYLIVYALNGEELWRSSDKFGGSELYFKREDLTNIRTTGDQYRWIFLEQRIVVTPEGEIIVPKSSGFFVFGNNRSYKKNSLFGFSWNGSTLEERWHTRESQNYLSDFFYDAGKKELVLLEVVKKQGLLEKGASAVVIKKVE